MLSSFCLRLGYFVRGILTGHLQSNACITLQNPISNPSQVSRDMKQIQRPCVLKVLEKQLEHETSSASTSSSAKTTWQSRAPTVRYDTSPLAPRRLEMDGHKGFPELPTPPPTVVLSDASTPTTNRDGQSRENLFGTPPPLLVERPHQPMATNFNTAPRLFSGKLHVVVDGFRPS